MNLKSKHIGKYFLGTCLLLLVTLVLYKSYPIIFHNDSLESGIVVAKNEAMSTGKYPHQQYIIAFKYDNPELGTRDIETSFSTWQSLKVGDRTSFVYRTYFHGWSIFWFIAGIVVYSAIALLILVVIGAILYKIWMY